ncbi:MAG TPA: M20 family metallopeptidase [Candidatus Elarobacter sp.]|jgi:amidohydrolase|nr:M20 family metallopeptidase [Candidatus Elarobacter sp.]
MTAAPIPHDDLVAVRRRLHALPELSMVEHDTAAFVAGELRALGLDEVRTGIGVTGVLGTLKGGQPGPVTLLRADMDALPIVELNQVPYKSQRSGVMHACGHDGHVSILLAAARTLAARRAEIAGTLVFCFQPGEEGHAGAKKMIDAGALENPHVERTFALHLFSGLDVGKIGVRDGAFFASADEFDLTIRGKGGHGAMPQLAVDPVAAGAYVITALQTVVSREIAPKDPAVITVGQFISGTTFNVIPDEAKMKGTVRAFDPDVRTSMPERMRRIIAGLATALRFDYEFDYHWSYPPTINSRAMNDIVREVGRRELGADNVVEHDIVMWAEDMSFMMNERPGSYFIVGARGGLETSFPHHNARFDIDERALDVGYRMMVALGLQPASQGYSQQGLT